MATTFTSNYQIKLIGTGLESGTWGTSTNENLKRIEQALGGSTLDLDVESPGGNSEWDDDNDELTWVTDDTADAGTAGSSGRYKFVKFTGSPDGDFYVYIRGSVSTELTNRIYFVQNATSGGFSMTFNSHATKATNTYTVLNGSFAVIYAESAVGSVDNLLSKLQIEDLVFPGAADVTIPADTTNALTIKDGVRNFIDIDSTTDTTVTTLVGETLRLDTAAITVANQATTLSLKENVDAALDIKEDDQSYIECDTQTSGPQVLIGGGAEVVTLNIDTATIDVASQATDFLLKTNDAAALEVYETTSGGTKMLAFDTTTPKVIVPVELEVTGTLDVDGTSDFSALATFTTGVDIDGAGTMDNTVIGGATHVAGKFSTLEATGLTTIGASGLLSTTTGYLNFETTTGTDGYGIRNNSGKVEAKDSGGSSWEPITSVVGTIAAATSVVSPDVSNRKGGFQLGAVKFYFDRIGVDSSSSETVDLSSEFSIIWTVIGCQSDDADSTRNSNFIVTSGSNTSVNVENNTSGALKLTYLCIGLPA